MRSEGARAFRRTLSYQPPLAWEALLEFLARRAVRGVEEVTGSAYRRSISVDGAAGILEVAPGRRRGTLEARVTGIEAPLFGTAIRRVRRVLGLDTDPRAIGRHLGRDPRLAPLVKADPGMRIPVTWDPFEAVVRAIVNQQISVAGAVTILGRLAERHGRALGTGGAVTHLFPGPGDLAHTDLSGLGIPASRARTIAEAARAVLDGRLTLDGSAPRTLVERQLLAIPGIGPWSAQYVALRGLGDPDAFPEADLGVRRALDSLGYPRGRAERAGEVRRLAPWRGYAALYLWRSISREPSA